MSIPGADPGFPVGGAPTLVGGGANLRHRHFSVKTYVKTKEFGPVGGGGALEIFVCRSATENFIQDIHFIYISNSTKSVNIFIVTCISAQKYTSH